MANLVTPAEVESVTGISVSAQDITRAQSVIEVVSGLDLSGTLATDYPRSADQRFLKQAVVWQTAYLDTHPELLNQESNLSRAYADGVGKDYAANAAATPSLLAPLASLALGRLSFNRTRVVSMRSDLENRAQFQTLVSDEGYPPWIPLP